MATIETRRPITLVTNWEDRAVVNLRNQPRLRLLRPNVRQMAENALYFGARLVVVSAGTRPLGRGAFLKREREIREKYKDDREEMKKRLSGFRHVQAQDIHREGQKRLKGLWTQEFGRFGMHVSKQLLEDAEHDFTDDIRLAARYRHGVILFMGHGSQNRAQNSDENLKRAVEWAEPDNPTRKLVVVTVAKPTSRGLLDRNGDPIPVYHGEEEVDEDQAAQAEIHHDIKKAHPDAMVAISPMSDHVIYDALRGRAGTLFKSN